MFKLAVFCNDTLSSSSVQGLDTVSSVLTNNLAHCNSPAKSGRLPVFLYNNWSLESFGGINWKLSPCDVIAWSTYCEVD